MRYAQTSVKPVSSPHLDQPHSSAQSALKSHSETDKILSNSRKHYYWKMFSPGHNLHVFLLNPAPYETAA